MRAPSCVAPASPRPERLGRCYLQVCEACPNGCQSAVPSACTCRRNGRRRVRRRRRAVNGSKQRKLHSSVAVPSAPLLAGGQEAAGDIRDSRRRRIAIVSGRPAPYLQRRSPLVALCAVRLCTRSRSACFTAMSAPTARTPSAPAKPPRQSTPREDRSVAQLVAYSSKPHASSHGRAPQGLRLSQWGADAFRWRHVCASGVSAGVQLPHHMHRDTPSVSRKQASRDISHPCPSECMALVVRPHARHRGEQAVLTQRPGGRCSRRHSFAAARPPSSSAVYS